MPSNLDECYRTLGLKPGASRQDVKRAHRDLAKVWHPDRFPGDPRLRAKAEEQLKLINEAYQALSREGAAKPVTPAGARHGGPHRESAAARAGAPRATAWQRPQPRRDPPGGDRPVSPADRPVRQGRFRGGQWLVSVLALAALIAIALYYRKVARPPASLQKATPAASEPGLPAGPRVSGGAPPQASPTAQVEKPPGRIAAQALPAPGPAASASLPFAQSKLPAGYFTVGSTQADVRRVEGSPAEANHNVWRYGASIVIFSDGRVVSWDIRPDSPLKVRLAPSRRPDAGLKVFRVGSTKDEVLVVQGTPTRLSDTVWKYGSSSVYFSDGRVTGWDLWSDSPLRVPRSATGR